MDRERAFEFVMRDAVARFARLEEAEAADAPAWELLRLRVYIAEAWWYAEHGDPKVAARVLTRILEPRQRFH